MISYDTLLARFVAYVIREEQRHLRTRKERDIAFQLGKIKTLARRLAKIHVDMTAEQWEAALPKLLDAGYYRLKTGGGYGTLWSLDGGRNTALWIVPGAIVDFARSRHPPDRLEAFPGDVVLEYLKTGTWRLTDGRLLSEVVG
jgi:hypothetical protein